MQIIHVREPYLRSPRGKTDEAYTLSADTAADRGGRGATFSLG